MSFIDISVDTEYDSGCFSEQKYPKWQLTFYLTQTDDTSHVAIIHTWCSDILWSRKTAEGIMAIRCLCKQLIIKDVFISSFENNVLCNHEIAQVKKLLKNFRFRESFVYIGNSIIIVSHVVDGRNWSKLVKFINSTWNSRKEIHPK